MKTTKTTTLAALGAVAFALIVSAPNRVAGAQPVVIHLDFSYVNTDLCGMPLLFHYTATEIDRFNPATGKFTSTFNARIQYTNPANGKTVSGVGAGPFYVKDDGTQVYSGLFMVRTDDGTVADAGVEEITFEYDPDTGTGAFVTTKHLGTGEDTSDVWAAICAALQ